LPDWSWGTPILASQVTKPHSFRLSLLAIRGIITHPEKLVNM